MVAPLQGGGLATESGRRCPRAPKRGAPAGLPARTEEVSAPGGSSARLAPSDTGARIADRLAVCALALGLLAVLGWLAFPQIVLSTALPAIVCGHMSRARYKAAGPTARGRRLATTGLVLAYLPFVALSYTFGPIRTKKVEGTLENVDTHQPVARALVVTTYLHSIMFGGFAYPVFTQCALTGEDGSFTFDREFAIRPELFRYSERLPMIRGMDRDGCAFAIPEAVGVQLAEYLTQTSQFAYATASQVRLGVRRWEPKPDAGNILCAEWRAKRITNLYSRSCQKVLPTFCLAH